MTNGAEAAQSRQESLVEMLRALTGIPAPSGYEDPVIAAVTARLQPLADPLEVDALGNVIARLKGTGRQGGLRLLLFAHMDEVGFVVRNIEPEGYLRIIRLGGIPEKSMAGQKVLVRVRRDRLQAAGLDEQQALAGGAVITGGHIWLPGVVGTRSHHYTPPGEKGRVVPADEAYVDLGLSSAAAVHTLGIEVGTPLAYGRQFMQVGSRIYANALDNRGGLAALLAAARAIAARPGTAAEVWVVASVQEEFNIRGVLPAVRRVNPDVAVCLDIGVACDTPDLRGQTPLALGRGPLVNQYSFHGRGTLGGLIPNPLLVEWVSQVAAAADLPLQRNVFFGGLTDASFLQLEGTGIPAVDLGFPARYTHAPVEACDLTDLQQLVQLLVALAAYDGPRPNLRRG